MNSKFLLLAVTSTAAIGLSGAAHAADNGDKATPAVWEASRTQHDGVAETENSEATATANESPAPERAVGTTGASADPIKAPTKKAPTEEAFSTGVAKGRDRLDSATSTSALKASEIDKFGARSLGEVLRNIPGVRVEYASGEGNANYSIRGLPLAASGSKYMQIQEDGLPVLEFGDMQNLTPDMFMRVDLNLAQVEAIRGGSASTFASNSPGGVINLLSKNGDVEGGTIQSTLGLNYGEHRLDADYGGKLSDTVRFHVGGFYRQGEGPRQLGYDGYKGGQVKLNVTKTFTNGFVRIYGKYLDDRTPSYQPVPLRVTGSNANPVFASPANFDLKTDTMLSNNNYNMLTLDGTNNIKLADLRNGQHSVVKSVGLESQFDFGEWTVSEKFRFAAISGEHDQNYTRSVVPTTTYTGVGSTLSYATGPLAGQAITSPTTLNGNGLLGVQLLVNQPFKLDNVTNDLRVSRVWKIGKGDLTTTTGFYKSSQDVREDWFFVYVLSDVRGGGNAALVNVTTAAGVKTTQDGYFAFGVPGSVYRRKYDVNYGVNAPYASVNYHIGALAVGGSARYDIGHVNGSVFGSELGGGRIGSIPFDINHDGKISIAETQTAVLPLGNPGKVDYDYHYLSYSGGVNFRIADPLAVFGRYSRGGRAADERVLFTRAFNSVTGQLVDPAGEYDAVTQTELGMKFRQSGVTLNITGFSANTSERNVQVTSAADGTILAQNIVRGYSAKGVEVEAGLRHGIFSLTAGGTYTSAKIKSDAGNAAIVGNIPRHQASFIYEATPKIDTKYVTVGANFIGTTSSYAQDVNQLKLPGYTLVNAFVQVRPLDRVQLMLNVNNLFDKLALAEITQGAIPTSGLVVGRAYNGRTISGTVGLSF